MKYAKFFLLLIGGEKKIQVLTLTIIEIWIKRVFLTTLTMINIKTECITGE